jgi:hypothetical protein
MNWRSMMACILLCTPLVGSELDESWLGLGKVERSKDYVFFLRNGRCKTAGYKGWIRPG